MSADSNHIIYSATDIEKYHRGELSPSAMHAMERAALDDPFLADAMEGYASRVEDGNAPAAQTDISDLQQRISARINEKANRPVIAFAWWKAAAIIVLLLGAGWLYTSINSKSKEQVIVANDKKPVKQATAPAVVSTDSLRSKNKDSAIQSAALAVNESKQKSNANAAAEADKQSVSETQAPLSRETEPSRNKAEDNRRNERTESASLAGSFSTPVKKADTSLKSSAATSAENYKGVAQVNAAKKADLPKEQNMPASIPGLAVASNTFNGTVVDQSNKPVANASVQVPNLNKAYTTDNNGYFSFKAPDTSLNVSIASVGFAQQNARLSNNLTAGNQIMLQPDTKSLNDVVVVGYGSEKKRELSRKTKDFSINVLDAEPSVDWNDYTEYLEKNKRVTDDMKSVHGDVVVSFVINNKNELTNFKIAKSLHTALDVEAIRLIKEGPSWRLLKGKKTKASVIVKF